jgi:hypothetical protein
MSNNTKVKSAWLFFVSEKKVKEGGDKIKKIKDIGLEWKSLSDDAKAPYYEMEAADAKAKGLNLEKEKAIKPPSAYMFVKSWKPIRDKLRAEGKTKDEIANELAMAWRTARENQSEVWKQCVEQSNKLKKE